MRELHELAIALPQPVAADFSSPPPAGAYRVCEDGTTRARLIRAGIAARHQGARNGSRPTIIRLVDGAERASSRPTVEELASFLERLREEEAVAHDRIVKQSAAAIAAIRPHLVAADDQELRRLAGMIERAFRDRDQAVADARSEALDRIARDGSYLLRHLVALVSRPSP